MTTAAPMTNPVDVRTYILHGRGEITLRSRKTGKHFTYRVRLPRNADPDDPRAPRFVSVLAGPDNTQSYVYLATIFDQQRLVLTQKSRFTPEATTWRAFNWLWHDLSEDSLHPSVEVWHNGKCCRCGRKLTDPTSIATGIGPVCAEKAA